jgi:renalase
MRIGVVGAGMAGLACATLLARHHDVALFDKGRGPGGRMATRRVPTVAGEASFDHGAQYFTVRDDGFRLQVEAWAAAGVVARWASAGVGTGAEAWVGVPAMNAPVKQLAVGLDVRWGVQVDALVRDGAVWRMTGTGLEAGPFDVVVLAIPAEQAGPLLGPWKADWAARAAAAPALPCWTVMAAFDARVDAPDVLKEDGVIGWAARNSAKPGRGGPEAWVVQAGAEWSKAHLEETPDAIVPQLMAAFAARAGGPLPGVLTASAHRWRYAKSGKDGSGALWDAGLGLGVCGDWLLGPRVECAWVSGTGLAAGIGG